MSERGQWFVLQTLSGQEMKARESILKRTPQEEMQDLVFETLVPIQKVTEVKLGRKTTVNRKFFPGYIFICALLYDDNRRINEKVWSFINDTPGIIGFVGGDKPAPMTDTEINDIKEQLQRDEDAPRPKIDYTLGEIVKIKEGPFENLEGKIENIDPDRGKLKLSVTIFDRSTPVEVEYWQVERAD
jgi:transcription termination/antitermination protein NusG